MRLSCTVNGDYDDDYCAEDGWSAGNTIGLGAAAAIDAFVLGYGGDGGAALAAPSWYGYQTLSTDGIALALSPAIRRIPRRTTRSLR